SSRAVSDAYIWMGDELCRRVLRNGLGGVDAVFVVGSSSRLIFSEARRLGCRTIMEAIIASPRTERALLEAEERHFPEWAQDGTAPVSEHFEQLVDKEYALADLIVCGSDFVRDSIGQSGGPIERCVVVPYGVSQTIAARPRRRDTTAPLRVLTVGAVGLRKGIPYVAEAARKLRGDCQFRLVGPLQAPASIAQRLSADLEYLGPVPKSQIGDHYGWADVFLLPSICEGSATVIYEALGHGLPVITTHNSGSVITHEREGLIVPTRDSSAIVNSLLTLSKDPKRLSAMSEAALATARTYSFERYAGKLVEELKKLG
ncbi:MAG: glycosyltransferase family 4 protein, partial [Opitutaceae bacterium]